MMIYECDPWEGYVREMVRLCEAEQRAWEIEQDLKIEREFVPPEVLYPEELPPRSLVWWDYYAVEFGGSDNE